MGDDLESRCVGRVYGADGDVQSHGTIRYTDFVVLFRNLCLKDHSRDPGG